MLNKNKWLVVWSQIAILVTPLSIAFPNDDVSDSAPSEAIPLHGLLELGGDR